MSSEAWLSLIDLNIKNEWLYIILYIKIFFIILKMIYFLVYTSRLKRICSSILSVFINLFDCY